MTRGGPSIPFCDAAHVGKPGNRPRFAGLLA